MPGVCLSVSVSNFRQKPLNRENFTTCVSVHVHKEELIKCWKSSASGSGSRSFLKDSSTLRDWAFSTIWISPDTLHSDKIFVKFLIQT